MPAPNNPLSQSIAGTGAIARPFPPNPLQDPMLLSMDKLFSEGEVIDTKASIPEELKPSPRLNSGLSLVKTLKIAFCAYFIVYRFLSLIINRGRFFACDKFEKEDAK